MRKHSDPPLIGLVGPAGAGKDTVAHLLTEHHGFAQVAFADALRDFTAEIDPAWRIARASLGYERAKWNVNGFRDRLIEIGQAARKHIGPRVWVLAAANRISSLLGAGFPVVVSDVRQRNEARHIISMGGTLVAVDRPGCPPDQFPDVAELMLECDHGIFNSGDLVDLKDRVDRLIVRDLAPECGAA